jgi:hypothetical protein
MATAAGFGRIGIFPAHKIFLFVNSAPLNGEVYRRYLASRSLSIHLDLVASDLVARIMAEPSPTSLLINFHLYDQLPILTEPVGNC